MQTNGVTITYLFDAILISGKIINYNIDGRCRFDAPCSGRDVKYYNIAVVQRGRVR